MRELVRAVPNEQWQLIMEFADGEFRVFEASTAREEKGWSYLAYPNKFKNFTSSVNGVVWANGDALSADYLHSNSRPVSTSSVENQVLRLGYKNQAPTAAHPTHHVYGVYLKPFSVKCFVLGESIGGGHGELGGSLDISREALLSYPDWKEHFIKSSCEWAIGLVEDQRSDPETLVKQLVQAVCYREGVAQV